MGLKNEGIEVSSSAQLTRPCAIYVFDESNKLEAYTYVRTKPKKEF